MSDDRLARIVAFDRALEERCSDRIIPSFLATALFNTTLPLVHDRNYIRLEDRTAGAAQLAALADHLQGEAGLTFRHVLIDDPEAGKRLRPQFVQLGWEAGAYLAMSYTPSGWPDDPDPEVEEVEAAALLGLWEQLITEDDGGEERLAQLTAAILLKAERGDARFFGLRADGQMASACTVFERGATAQIEDVMTLPAFRNRGLASRVVTTAAGRAWAHGHDLVWLFADVEDWPKALYAKLGFTPVAELAHFKRLDV